MRRSTAVLLLFALLATAACAVHPRGGTPTPPPYAASLQAVLSVSGDNSAAIQAFLDTYAQDQEKLQAATFLAANLPLGDAVSMTADQLRELVDWAFVARQTFPWARAVPWDVFLHYALPHRAAQEPFQPHRRQLILALAPRLADARDAAAATQAVALWCVEQTEYVGTSRRDQGVATTLVLGRARCEEAAILFVAAARSVGIPARVATTPAWQFADDNHAWAEVWIDGAWRYLDPANPGPDLDRAWFSDNARRAVLVLSSAYGGQAPTEAGAELYRQGPGYTLLNTTARYARTWPLRVRVLGPDGQPLPNAVVAVCIYNYAELKPAAWIACDAEGRGAISLGQSALLLTAAWQGKRDFALVRLGPDNDPGEITLDLRRDRLPTGAFWLAFGHWPEQDSPSAAVLAREKALEQVKARLAEAREKARLAVVHAAARIAAAGPQDLVPAEALDRAGRNSIEIACAAAQAPEPIRSAVAGRIGKMDAKDLADSTAQGLMDDTAAALEARALAQNRLGLAYGEDIFDEYVLTSRISPYEPHSLYHRELLRRRAHLARGSATDTALRVNRLTSSLRRAPRSLLDPGLTPVQALASGSVSTERDRAVACTGLLRALGVPARYLDQWGWGRIL